MKDIERIIGDAFPEQRIVGIQDRGYWLGKERFEFSKAERISTDDWRGKRVCFFTLDDNERYCLKLADPNNEWDSDFTGELLAYKLLADTSVPMPTVVKIDTSKTLTDTNYIIVSFQEGTRLSTLWLQAEEEEKHEIYRAVGKSYGEINGIKGIKSGLFKTLEDPYETRYPIHPADFMLEAEIAGGSGRRAVEKGVLRGTTHDKIVQLWKSNLDFLKDHVPSLVHYSAFCWTVSLKRELEWHVSKLTCCGDMLWWDPAINQALFRYPPFLQTSDSHWDSFLGGYAESIDDKRIALYGLLVTLLAAMGVYFEPESLQQEGMGDLFAGRISRLIDEIG